MLNRFAGYFLLRRFTQRTSLRTMRDHCAFRVVSRSNWILIVRDTPRMFVRVCVFLERYRRYKRPPLCPASPDRRKLPTPQEIKGAHFCYIDEMELSCAKAVWFCAMGVLSALLPNALLVAGSLNKVKYDVYGQNSRSPRSMLARINANNKVLSSDAHILKTTVKRSSARSISLTVDLTVGLPPNASHLLIMDEIYLKFHNTHQKIPRRSSVSRPSPIQDLWVTDGTSTKRPLARVALASHKTGYQAIPLRNILNEWLNKGKSSGVLSIEIKSGNTRGSRGSLSLKLAPYVVAYTTRLINAQVPKPIKCHADVISVPIGDNMLPRRLQTKICSRFEDITFPFSDVFHVGRAVKSYVSSRRLPRNSLVLKNPQCCHGLRSGSMNFVVGGRPVHVENAKIIKCGCKDV